MILAMTNAEKAFFDGVVAGFNHGRAQAHTALARELERRYGLPPLDLEQAATIALLAQLTETETRPSIDIGNAEVAASVRAEMARRIGPELAAQITADADAVVALRADAVGAHGGGGKISFEGFGETAAKLVTDSLYPQVDFAGVATLVTEDTGLTWAPQDVALGFALHGCRMTIDQIAGITYAPKEDRAQATALMEDQAADIERALGPARSAIAKQPTFSRYLEMVQASAESQN